jgi:hypothetical protein
VAHESEGPGEWDLPPKPTGMRRATYERWVARYDTAEEQLDMQLALAAARLMKRSSVGALGQSNQGWRRGLAS